MTIHATQLALNAFPQSSRDKIIKYQKIYGICEFLQLDKKSRYFKTRTLFLFHFLQSLLG